MSFSISDTETDFSDLPGYTGRTSGSGRKGRRNRGTGWESRWVGGRSRRNKEVDRPF